MRSIAIVGMACRYPEARTPQQLWENVLAQRPSFRRLPPVRLRTEDYQGPEDAIRCEMAAVIEDYEFDRARYRVSAPAYRSIDMSHWVAMEVAGEMLERVPHESLSEQTGVFVGNTLTSEFARANLMRLRWPFVERVLRTAIQQVGRQEDMEKLVPAVENLYKSPFPATGEESLAGGLSNTIAGRICNTFHLQGGGYTVDGACASSLLAVANACSSLASGSIELALAGGVDLSMDPFELAGFSALGALASHAMRVYDRRPTGFWPGEGCGFVALMREEEALARGIPVLARIRGWGVSSDGRGSITRPEVSGQLLALERAYQSAGYGIGTVAYFEGHGTGTAVGDATELDTLKQARRRNGAAENSAAIGSIKTLIGHTKAAAGVASLIKAAYAVSSQVIPPTAGCEDPHPGVAAAGLRCPKRAELWPGDAPLRAGVSAMGFGGINTHVALEGIAAARRTQFTVSEAKLSATRQDAEVFPLSARDSERLLDSVNRLRRKAIGLSIGELADCSAALAGELDLEQPWRAAVVASTPKELASRLDCLAEELGAENQRMQPSGGIYWSDRTEPGRIGLLFPGQSSPVYRDGNAWSRRFREVDELYREMAIPDGQDSETQVAQPAIAMASAAALCVLRGLGIEGELGLGHSLGELPALCWAEALPPKAMLELARERGRLMGESASRNPGAMLSVSALREEVETISQGLGLVVACHNSNQQTVVSGAAEAIERLEKICANLGVASSRLPVKCGFHSPLMKPAADEFGRVLRNQELARPRRKMISSVTGKALEPDACLRLLLERQITAPVEFAAAIESARGEADLWIEAGPGQVLSGIAKGMGITAVALDAGGASLTGLCHAVAAAFVLKRNINFPFLFGNRKVRPFQFETEHTYLANPCESVAVFEGGFEMKPSPAPEPAVAPRAQADPSEPVDCLLRLRQLVATRSELPVETILPEHRFLSDLHLNSITVTQLVAQAASELGLPPPVMPLNYSTVTLAEAGAALEELRRYSRREETDSSLGTPVAGVDTWVRPFAVTWPEKAEPKQSWRPSPGSWFVLSDGGSGSSPAADLQRALESEGSGLLVWLEKPDREAAGPVMLTAARQLATGRFARFVVVQENTGAESFFRSLFLENPRVDMTIITARCAIGTQQLVREAMTTAGFREVMFDFGGARRERSIHSLPFPEDRGFPLAPGSRLLVTGGGRGIGLECGLELARRHRLELVILGRSPVDSDEELRQNLSRICGAGVEYRYYSADATDANQVRAALVGERIDGVIHAAGLNHPERASLLTRKALEETVAPKRDGLRNVLAALQIRPPELVVAFGSIIAQAGLDGEAHYAVANDWMGRELADWASRNPASRALQIDWSVWAGAGMGERLGSLEALVRRGIAPISIESGAESLDRMIRGSKPGFDRVILTGRFGVLPTFPAQQAELPLLRFLESQKVHIPGIELICDAILSEKSDPYFADHEVEGQRLLPAVMGLEAMAQACCALAEGQRLAAIENIEFARPVVLSAEQSQRVRVAALVREPGIVEAVLRSEETRFRVDHFKASFVFQPGPPPDSPTGTARMAAQVSLDPERDLYGSILFHRGRFRRIEKYLELDALRCSSLLRTDSAGWFGSGMPETLLLGDPGARDAAIHSIQACIPHSTLLPVRVRRITFLNEGAPAPAQRVASAVARSHLGDEYVYDLVIQDPGGPVLERWDGLALRKFASARVDTSQWTLALLVPYLQWAAAEFSVPVKVAIRNSPQEDRNERGRQVAEALLGSGTRIHKRPDGKPETGSGTVSFSHMEPFTLGVHARGMVSCDLVEVEKVDPAQWRNLLGEELYSLAGLVSTAAREPVAYAAARVWAAYECVQKTDADPGRRLTFLPERSNGWICFGAGTKRVVVGMRRFSGVAGPVAVGILVDQGEQPGIN